MSIEAKKNGQTEAKQKLKIIAVAAGKGGVGKTNIAINLACALAQQNKKVLLFDGDLSMSNICVQLNLKVDRDIEQVLQGQCQLDDILIQGPYAIDIIPGSTGRTAPMNLSYVGYAGLISAFDLLRRQYDVMLIDTPAGLSDGVGALLRASQEVVIVVCNEPASITDSYALMKHMSQHYQIRHFHLVANMVQKTIEGRDLYQELLKISNDYLDITLDYLGAIPYDLHVKKAIMEQNSIYQHDPNTMAAKAFTQIAKSMLSWPSTVSVEYCSPFFIEKLLDKSLFKDQ